MAKTATHMGTCQICGHFQKLPGGKLSLHGYTKQWGFFNGTCPGSRYQPFETGTDRIEAAIESSLRTAAHLRESADALEASDEKWAHVYVPATWAHRKSGYEWVSVESFVYEGGRLTITGTDGKTRELGYITRSGHYTPDAMWTARRAELAGVRRGMAADHDRYVAWQRERIAGWTPQELKPVTTAA